MSEQVSTTVQDGVLCIRLDRPEKRNALTASMYAALAEALEQAEQDSAIAVVLFEGVEGVFTAGNDLGDFLRNPPQGAEAPVFRFISALVETDLPLVAAVDGIAVGIGTTMLLHCDFVLASERSTFSLPFINLALVPEAGSSMLLVQAAGYRKAAEWLLLGEPFTAGEAASHGIVSTVCAAGDLAAAARELAAKLAAKPRGALRASKRLMRRRSEALADRVQAEGALFTEALATPEAREAFSAFLEKRRPDFSQFRRS